MGRDIYFMPLGGGQRVGASCYYLKLGEVNIILDAGIGKERGMVFEPDLYPLVTSPLIQSLSQINQIYISHAHADHVGYLFELMGKTSRAEVYMTEITALLSQHQLYDKKYLSGGERSEVKRLKAQSMLDKITKVSYLQEMEFGSYKATFLPAGHIPGAMMILFEWKKRRILYTGDYSMESMPLTDGCMIPDDLEIDTIIMCGLHARHPGYVKKTDKLFKSVRYVLRLVKEKKVSVMCRIRQLSKGIEFLKILNQRNVEHIPIFIDESILKVVTKMEQLSVPILDMCNKMMGSEFPREPHIYITSDYTSWTNRFYQKVDVDFCLHGDFSEMKQFIKKINPRQAVIVHCAKEYSPFDQTIEQAMMMDGECRTQFIFAEEKEIYQL